MGTKLKLSGKMRRIPIKDGEAVVNSSDALMKLQLVATNAAQHTYGRNLAARAWEDMADSLPDPDEKPPNDVLEDCAINMIPHMRSRPFYGEVNAAVAEYLESLTFAERIEWVKKYVGY